VIKFKYLEKQIFETFFVGKLACKVTCEFLSHKYEQGYYQPMKCYYCSLFICDD
jgi:hypothetical protein